ncbi:hypothetical protein CANMA_003923 [Candida margitis]|uniref:uncharacterized protein n=1 Tax=Candida margitis TaxID=1775924 RepID=UPI002227F9A3|nr:uncharacterized protein CANMA_003923 [Candida margitis]KAI5961149.1 hypothetical protein CANMA_003923 [Candida margitis]
MPDIDNILQSIITATKAANTAVEEFASSNAKSDPPTFIENLLDKSGSAEAEGISLLSLKNQSLASYINNLALIVLGQIERLDSDKNETIKQGAVERSIVQRVTLEKGVKPLEKKINYQIENLLKAFSKAESQDLQNRKEEEDQINDDSEAEEEEDVDSEDDEMAFRPDAAALAKLAPQANKTSSSEKYRPPKISAVAPPTSKETTAKTPTQKLQSMEEYLQEQSDLPTAEASIGSTIVSHGRGGVKTQHDRKKEKEIQTYEEANFTRLPTAQTKKSFKQKQRDMVNQFAGEDWSIFNKDKNLESGTSRKRKPTTSWDRAKKKRT